MQVQDIMHRGIERIDRNAAISSAARLMRERGVGMLPVEYDGEIVGTLTDRDITVRATARSADPDSTAVGDVMSSEIYTCDAESDLQEAARIMEEHQVRRLMVQNSSGDFVGVLALADLARHRETESLGAEVLEEVSQPGAPAAAAH